jgi:hypothetical protein
MCFFVVETFSGTATGAIGASVINHLYNPKISAATMKNEKINEIISPT